MSITYAIYQTQTVLARIGKGKERDDACDKLIADLSAKSVEVPPSLKATLDAMKVA